MKSGKREEGRGEDGRLLVLFGVAGVVGLRSLSSLLSPLPSSGGSRGVARKGSGPHRTLRSPSSPPGDIPLTETQERNAWDAGYEAASKLSRGGDETHLDPEEGFLWAIRNDKRLPRGLKEDDPSFWEYELAFREGFVAYTKNEGFEIFGGSKGVARSAREAVPPRRLTRPLLEAMLEKHPRRSSRPGPSAKAIQERLGRHFEHEGWDPKEAAATLKEAMGLLSPRRVLELANTILAASGLDYIADRDDDQHEVHGLDYANMGDTYTATLIYDHRKGRYYAGDLGSIVERGQSRFP